MVQPLLNLLPNSLITRVFVLYTITLLLFVGTSIWLFFNFQFRQEIEHVRHSAHMQAEAAAQIITESARTGDHGAIQSVLDRAVLNPQVAAATFTDANGVVLRSRNHTGIAGYLPSWMYRQVASRLDDIQHPTTIDVHNLGVLRLELAIDMVAKELWDLLLTALALALTSLVLGLLIIGIALRRWLASFQRLSASSLAHDPQLEALAGKMVEAVPVEFRQTFEVLHQIAGNLRLELRQREQALAVLRRALSNLMPDAPAASSSPQMDIAALARVVLQMVQEREAGRQALQDAMHTAQSANRAKSEFLAVMSHEIRTPMNSVIGMTALTLETELTPTQREYLTLVKKSADDLLTIINDILDFSKIEAGQLHLDLRPLRLHSLVRNTLNNLDSQARLKGLRLAYETDARVPQHLIGDAGRLRQILVNLVGNAIKFSRQGIVRVAIRREPDHEGQVLLRFDVQDQGIGIPPEKQAAIFAPFSQADTSTTRHFGGTGLGLAICSQLVRAMGGVIGVCSRPGEGSTFHFTARFDLDHSETNSDVGPGHAARNADQSRRLQVLLVEDNEVNQKLALALLGQEGHAVDVASHGAEAVELATRGDSPYDLILMDMQMPVMDGLEATRRIRAHEHHTREHVRIVAMTANAMPEDRARCLAAGMDEYLTKPIRLEELRATLRWQDSDYVPSMPAGLMPLPEATGAAAVDYRAALASADAITVRIIGESFRGNWPQLMRDMHLARAGNDAEGLRRGAHSLRGVLGNFGAAQADALCRSIELQSSHGAAADLDSLLDQLQTELTGLDRALAEFLQRPA